MNIMLDIESASTRMDAAILSIGAVRFTEDRIEDYTFYRAITLDSNTALGRHIDGATLAWWMAQDDTVRAAAFADPCAVNLAAALYDFGVWLRGASTCRTGEAEPVHLWGNGANFDVSILESAHAAALVPVPWNFRDVRCMRTVRALVGAEAVPRVSFGNAHHALHDAMGQAKWLQDAWRAGVGRMGRTA